MGKLKKACKNAYFYFVREEKEAAERMGYRVQGGFNNWSATFGYKWKEMSKEEKAPYEQMAKNAKEDEKYNINNKFTVTGESYAQVYEKQKQQKSKEQQMEDFIRHLVSGPEGRDRTFIFMKAVHCVEEIIDRKNKQYWPCELAMVAFSLKGGIKAVYTQLVDTVETPTGYASQAKENCEESALPMPGDQSIFDEQCRDYHGILQNINGFAKHWLKAGYKIRGHKKVFFALDTERETITSCLQWLVNELPSGRARDKYQKFVNELKVYKLSRLIIHMALEANRVNPEYNSYLVQFKLDSAADSVITKANYDYREEIACSYHHLDNPSTKMHNCAQSIVTRRALMLFEEFVPAFQLGFTMRHRIDGFGKTLKGQTKYIKRRRERSPSPEVFKKIDEPSWLKSNNDVEVLDYGSSSRTYSGPSPPRNAWGYQPPQNVSASSLGSSDFPSLNPGRSNSDRHQSSSSGNRMWERRPSAHSNSSRSPPSNRQSSSSDFGFGAASNSGASGRGAPTASWLDDVETVDYAAAAPAGRGRSAETTTRSFMDDDDDGFPPLGSVGRGRGARY